MATTLNSRQKRKLDAEAHNKALVERKEFLEQRKLRRHKRSPRKDTTLAMLTAFALTQN